MEHDKKALYLGGFFLFYVDLHYHFFCVIAQLPAGQEYHYDVAGEEYADDAHGA